MGLILFKSLYPLQEILLLVRQSLELRIQLEVIHILQNLIQ